MSEGWNHSDIYVHHNTHRIAQWQRQAEVERLLPRRTGSWTWIGHWSLRSTRRLELWLRRLELWLLHHLPPEGEGPSGEQVQPLDQLTPLN